MYHSITFQKAGIGNKNTWDDWHLVPTSRPVIQPPDPKIVQVDVPFSDGVLDLTNSLSDYTHFNNRTGSLEFIVVNDLYHPVQNHEEWYVTYSNVLNYLHGQKLKMILEDDRGWYYEGRFAVNEWKSDSHHSTITIDYDVKPYKYSLASTMEDWLWDPFNFITGIIPSNSFRNITLPPPNGSSKVYVAIAVPLEEIGDAPVTPVFRCTFTHPSGTALIPYLSFQTDMVGYSSVKTYDASPENQPIIIPELVYHKTMSASQRRIIVASDTAGYTGSLSVELRRGSL